MSDEVCKPTCKCKCNIDRVCYVPYEHRSGHPVTGIWTATKHLACMFIIVYIVWSSYEISSLKSEMRTILQKLEDPHARLLIRKNTYEGLEERISDVIQTASLDEVNELHPMERFRRSANSSRPAKNGGKKRRQFRKRKRRRRCRCKDGKPGPTGQTGPRGPQGMTGPALATLAGHYVAKAPPVGRHEATGCIFVWNGTYCNGNFTYVNREPDDVLQFFESSSTMGNVSSAFKSTNHGEFVIRQEGLMLFYFNIALYSKGPLKDKVALYVDENRIMKCIETKDWTSHSDISPFFNAKEKSCSSTGMHYVRENQVVRMKVLSRETPITLLEDMTFFGAVLLR